jgi:large subunit ribosomal protein L10
MAKTRLQKEQIIQNLAKKIKNAKAVVFANFQGLSVKKQEELRDICKSQGAECTASKKTLLNNALKSMNFETDTRDFDGGVAVISAQNDEVAPSQIVSKFAKDNEAVRIFGGILENQLISADKVKQLSAIPSKKELLAKLVGSMNSPISGFVNVLAGNLRGLVNVLNAIKNTKS